MISELIFRFRRTILTVIFSCIAICIIFVSAILDKGEHIKITIVSLILPALGILQEFLPDILYKINNSILNSSFALKQKIATNFTEYLKIEFNLIAKKDKKNYKQDFYLLLEDIVNGLNISDFEKNSLLIIFIINNEKKIKVDFDFDSLPYIKNKFRSISDENKNQFIYFYHNTIISKKEFNSFTEYFKPTSKPEFDKTYLSFLSSYLKDQAVDYMLSKIRLSQTQTTSFQRSFTEIARSEKLSANYLSSLANRKKEYSRAFLLISEQELPAKIQIYIKQNPYFILKWSSIANLPHIGKSKQFDVFLFSPFKMFPTPESLFTEFSIIDKSVKNHPLRIYTLDPVEAFANKLSLSKDFAEAISFFEFGTYDYTKLEKIGKSQIYSLLEYGKISLEDIIREMPIHIFSNSILPAEITYIEEIAKRFLIDNKGKSNIFEIIGNENFKETLIKTDIDTIKYTRKNIETFFGRKGISKLKIKARMELIYFEILKNVTNLEKLLLYENKLK